MLKQIRGSSTKTGKMQFRQHKRYRYACTLHPLLHTHTQTHLNHIFSRFERKSYLLSCLLGAGLKTKVLNWPTYKHTNTHTYRLTEKESNGNVSFPFFVAIKTDLNNT